MAQYVKDPASVLDYARDWSEWLAAGETITTSTWTADPTNADAVLHINSSSQANGVATIWLSGGTVGVVYRITNRVTTSAARVDERTDSWVIRER